MVSIQSPWDIVVILTLVGVAVFTLKRFAFGRSPRWLVITLAGLFVQFFIIEIVGGMNGETISENYTNTFSIIEMIAGTTWIYIVLMIHWVDLWRRNKNA